MRRLIVLSCLVVSFVFIGSQSRAAEVTGNLNLIVGQKLLPEADWKEEGLYDLSKQLELGIMFDIRAKSWPVNIAVDLLSSAKEETVEGVDIEGKTTEFAVGVRKYFKEDKMVKPYIGGGIASINGEFALEDLSIDDTAIGPWVDVGIKYNPIPQLNIGLDGRYSYAKTEIEDWEFQSGGWHWGVFVGWAF